MDVDDLNLVIILEVLTKLCDVNIHRTCIEVVIINPDGLQGEVTLEDLICMAAKQRKKFILLGCELNHLIAIGKELLLCIENEAAELIYCALLCLLSTNTTKDSLYTEYKLFH